MKLSRECLERATKHGSTQAQYEFGRILLEEGNREKAEKGLNVPQRMMRGRKQVVEFCFAMSTKATKKARNISTLLSSKDTSLPKKQ